MSTALHVCLSSLTQCSYNAKAKEFLVIHADSIYNHPNVQLLRKDMLLIALLLGGDYGMVSHCTS